MAGLLREARVATTLGGPLRGSSPLRLGGRTYRLTPRGSDAEATSPATAAASAADAAAPGDPDAAAPAPAPAPAGGSGGSTGMTALAAVLTAAATAAGATTASNQVSPVAAQDAISTIRHMMELLDTRRSLLQMLLHEKDAAAGPAAAAAPGEQPVAAAAASESEPVVAGESSEPVATAVPVEGESAATTAAGEGEPAANAAEVSAASSPQRAPSLVVTPGKSGRRVVKHVTIVEPSPPHRRGSSPATDASGGGGGGGGGGSAATGSSPTRHSSQPPPAGHSRSLAHAQRLPREGGTPGDGTARTPPLHGALSPGSSFTLMRGPTSGTFGYATRRDPYGATPTLRVLPPAL